MTTEKELCILCAWRATCQKQFSMKAGAKCPEFVRDLTIRDDGGIKETEVKKPT